MSAGLMRRVVNAVAREVVNSSMSIRKSVGPLSGDAAIFRSLWSQMSWTNRLHSPPTTLAQPYKDSVWVYASINTIARNASKVPIKLVERDRQDKAITSGNIFELLRHPNSWMTKRIFIEAISIFLNIYGECILAMRREDASKTPKSIWPLNPLMFDPVVNQALNAITGWMYNGSAPIPFAYWEILFLKYFNPYDNFRGMSPLDPGAMAVDQDYYASMYNKNFFKQGVKTSGFISVKESLSDDDFNRILDQFEGEHEGYEKAHRIALIDNDGKFTESKISHKDMEFINLHKKNRSEIFAIYKTNEVVLGLYEDVQCYHPDTDVMTDKGFVGVKDVKVGDKLASLDQNGKVEFKNVTKTYVYDHDGDMYTQKKTDSKPTKIDFMVTPKHNMYGKEKDRQGEAKDDVSFMFEKVSDIEQDRFSSPRNGIWDGKIEDTYSIDKVDHGNYKKNGKKGTEFKIVPWLKFLGWFISEGCLVKDGKSLKITQSGSYDKNRLRCDLDQFDYDYNEYSSGHGTDFVINGNDLCSYLSNNIGKYCYEKRIPRDILELHPKLLKHLFNTLMRGDATNLGKDNYVYYTTSKQLAEDVYELAIKIGRVATFMPTRGTEVVKWNSSKDDDERSLLNRRPLYKVYITSVKESNKMSVLRPEKVQYKGKVYCFEVPPCHTVLTRYNGRILWCGNSYEGIKMAHKAFWEEGMVPHLGYIEEFINDTLFAQIEGGRYKIIFDLASVGALHDDYAVRIDTAKKMWSIGFPLNDINDRLELGMKPQPWGKVWWVPMGMIPADIAMEQADNGVLGANNLTPTTPQTPGQVPTDGKPTKPGPVKPADNANAKPKPKPNDANKMLWNRYITVQLRLEELYRSKLKKFIFDQRKAVIESIIKDKEKQFDIKRDGVKLQRLMGSLYLEAMKAGAEMIVEELGLSENVDVKFNIENPKVVSYLQSRLSIVPIKILSTIDKNVQTIIDNKESKDMKVEMIRTLYNNITKRVNSIARTESSSVLVVGRIVHMQTIGIQYNKWISSRRDTGRQSHADLDGLTVRIGESFSPDFVLRYPGDLMAPIDETMGCTCFTIAANKPVKEVTNE